MGPNGAGKSTLLRAATALVPLAGGRVVIEGRDRWRSSAASRRSRSGGRGAAAARGPAAMRVEELVLLGRNPHLGLLGRETERDFEIARDAMRRAGCEEFAERTLGTLSGGQRRRAFIARALAQEAATPAAGRAHTRTSTCRRRPRSFGCCAPLARDGVAVLVVLHDLTLAAAYCDRLALLDAGRVVASGAPREVLTAANVARVYGEPRRRDPRTPAAAHRSWCPQFMPERATMPDDEQRPRRARGRAAPPRSSARASRTTPSRSSRRRSGRGSFRRSTRWSC